MSDAVLIIGGGLSGLAAAVACSKLGVRAIVVERGAIVGGKLAAPLVDGLDVADLGSAGSGLDLEAVRALANDAGLDEPAIDQAGVDKKGSNGIEIFTLADVESLEGEPGVFTVSIRQRARFVTDACTRCNNCPQVCPQVSGNEFDAGLTYRKAIYTPLQQTLPGAFVVDIDTCLNTPPNYLPCQRCVEVCDDNAIDFSMPLVRWHQRRVAAVIIAAGFEEADNTNLKEFGYGVYPDVVTSVELQRLLQSPGPTGGFVAKPSNEEYPEVVLFVLQDNAPFATYILAQQMARLAEQDIEQISLLVLEQRGVGADADLQALDAMAADADIPLCRGSWVGVREVDEKRLRVGTVDLATGVASEQDFDMVVLSSDVAPAVGLAELAATLEVNLTDSGYIEAVTGGAGGEDVDECPLATSTSRPGIFVAGCAAGPFSIAQSLEQARAAVTAVVGHCCSQSSSFADSSAAEKTEQRGLSEDEQRLRIERVLESLMLLGERHGEG
ncbi:MAG: FAD-dependent oxidoreductase [Motiliproteus sp.]